jgi:hypothetical protein
MASEYNLIPVRLYDKLMKIQKKIDTEANEVKIDGKIDRVDNKEHTSTGDNGSNITDKKHIEELSTETGRSNTKHLDIPNIDADHNDKTRDISNINNSTKRTHSKRKDLTYKAKVDKKSLNITSKLKHKGRNHMPAQDDVIEDIADNFKQPLRRKVKRLIVYMFKFGRDIELKYGDLYYKNELLGDVVKLIKSLFDVIPRIKGLRKLRRVLFVLSVPSELYTLSAKERNVVSSEESIKVDGGVSKLDWLKY